MKFTVNLETTNGIVTCYAKYDSGSSEQVDFKEVVRRKREDLTLKCFSDTVRREYQQHGKSDKYKRLKLSLPCVVIASQCEGHRNDDAVRGFSGLVPGDIDGLTPEELPMVYDLIKNDPHTMGLTLSVSGAGLHWVVPYRVLSRDGKMCARDYKKAWSEIMSHYEELTLHKVDPHPKSISNYLFMSYDPEVYYNPDAVPFEVEPAASKPKSATTGWVVPEKDPMQMAIHYVERCGAQYVEGSRNNYVSRFGYAANRLGIPEHKVLEFALNNFSDLPEREVRSTIASCYRKNDEHGTMAHLSQGKRSVGRPKSKSDQKATSDSRSQKPHHATTQEILAYLLEHYEMRHNNITDKTEYCLKGCSDFREMEERDLNSIIVKMTADTGMSTTPNAMLIVVNSDAVPSYAPLQMYLDQLPEWHEGEDPDYIAELAATVETTTPQIWEDALKRWLVAMVRGVTGGEGVRPNMIVLTLIGRQGIYKSTFMEYLLPPELRRYYKSMSNIQAITKDDRIAQSENLIICLDEITSMPKREANILKSFITNPSINERPAYAHLTQRRNRIVSFCATGNDIQFLSDDTGNRRWLPIYVTHIDSPINHPFNYTGIYSQVKALAADTSFKSWYDTAETEQLSEHMKQFEVPNAEEELIAAHFRKPEDYESGMSMSVTEIKAILDATTRTILSPVKIGNALTHMGFQSKTIHGTKKYLVVQIRLDERQLNQTNEALEIKKGGVA